MAKKLHGDEKRINDLAKIFRSLGYEVDVRPIEDGFTDLKVVATVPGSSRSITVSRRGIDGFPPR